MSNEPSYKTVRNVASSFFLSSLIAVGCNEYKVSNDNKIAEFYSKQMIVPESLYMRKNAGLIGTTVFSSLACLALGYTIRNKNKFDK